MTNITYRELQKIMNSMPDNRLDDNISIYLKQTDEYYPIKEILVADQNNGILDKEHVYLTCEA